MYMEGLDFEEPALARDSRPGENENRLLVTSTEAGPYQRSFLPPKLPPRTVSGRLL